jgi:tRNA (adenine57-N1/adenine58-N1)-methyltransferase catalytic subunit
VNAIAGDVDEALTRLKDVESRARDYHTGTLPSSQSRKGKPVPPGKPQEAQKTLFKEGRVVHRSEPELKAHTSYLVFAVLPMEWTVEDEARARARWSKRVEQPSLKGGKSHRQLKREAKQKKKRHEEGGRNSVDSSSMKARTEVADSVGTTTTQGPGGGTSDQIDVNPKEHL